MKIKETNTISNITVVSGFLGAGKSTLIQKILKELDPKEKVVLVENDFGEISIDAALLKTHGIQVKEMNAGCICCSLSGDFVQALKELIEQFHPDRILIEPSGVGKLSDVVKACADPEILPVAKIDCRIAIADVKRCKMYLDNFGEFFEDQIENADVILLSRTEAFPNMIEDTCALLAQLNATAHILTVPWEELNTSQLLQTNSSQPEDEIVHKVESPSCTCGHEHHEEAGHTCSCGHSHDEPHLDCDCGHCHTAEDAFDTVTVQTRKIFSAEGLSALAAELEKDSYGTILRAKGIVRGSNGYLQLQYVPGDIRVTKCDVTGEVLCIIGQNLHQDAVRRIFDGE